MPDDEEFVIAIPQPELDDLAARLARTRKPDALEGVGWELGTSPSYLGELLEHWRTGFDWRAQERYLNTYEQRRAVIDGLRVHYLLAGPPDAVPILLLHGWPGSFVQMLDLCDRLARPARPGADAAGAFRVIVASLPGFGFSDPARHRGLGVPAMGKMFHRLMVDILGYTRYAVRGSDFGAGVATQMAVDHPEALIGIHLSGTSPHMAARPPDATPDEIAYLDNVRAWRETEVGYGAISGTRPQTLAAALADSPAGTAAWIVEKFRRWSDCDGDVERRFTKDQLLLNISVYWLTNSIGSSIRLYYESRLDPPDREPDVPAAHLMSTKDMFRTPRDWIARHSRIDRFTEIDRGGHFLEWEEPDLVADDIRAFFADRRPEITHRDERSHRHRPG